MANDSDATENGGMTIVGQRQVTRRHGQAGDSAQVKALEQEVRNLQHELSMEKVRRRQAEQKAERLEARVAELEDKIDKLLEGFRATERMYQKEIDRLEVKHRDETGKLKAENEELKERVVALQKTVAWFTKEKFDGTAEDLPKDCLMAEIEWNEPGSVMFGEPEGAECNEPGCLEANEPRAWRNNEPGARGLNEPKEGAKPKGQQPGSKGHGRTDRSGVPVSETLTLKIPGGCACAKCGRPYTVLPETDDSSLVEIMTVLEQILYRRLRYAPQCKCPGNRIETAPPPARLYPGTTIGNTLWVYLAVQKFLFGIPTNRTLKSLSLQRLPLAHGTVVGGFKIINELLTPLYDAVVEHCQKADLWNGDETTWRIFDAETVKWWLWLFASRDAIVYILDASRSGQVPQEFFAQSAGTLMTDRYSAYKTLSAAILKAWCWVHQRRDIFKLFQGVPELKLWAEEWLLEIAQLFVLENKRQVLWKEGRTTGNQWALAQKAVEEHIQALKARWESQLEMPKLKKQQKQVLESLKRHWDGLTLFLCDPRIPLHNNRAERLIRGPVVLRKNSYGSGSEWSGDMAAKFFTLFHTWLVNGLDPEALLLDYFNECSKTPGKPPPDIRQFLPWSMSEERKQAFALPKTFKMPG